VYNLVSSWLHLKRFSVASSDTLQHSLKTERELNTTASKYPLSPETTLYLVFSEFKPISKDEHTS